MQSSLETDAQACDTGHDYLTFAMPLPRTGNSFNRRKTMRNVLLLSALLSIAACGTTTSPTPGNTCETDSQCAATDTVTVTDTITVTDTLPRTMAQLRFVGFRTPLPDRRFCVYVAPIPADTTRRAWVCTVQADTSAHYVRP